MCDSLLLLCRTKNITLTTISLNVLINDDRINGAGFEKEFQVGNGTFRLGSFGSALMAVGDFIFVFIVLIVTVSQPESSAA